MRTNGYRPHDRPTGDERGFGTVQAVVALVVLGVVFLSIFLMTSTSKTPTKGNNQQNQQTENQAASNSNEPPFIRIPENSKTYQNDQYKFSFAYPDSFGNLTSSSVSSTTNTINTIVFSAESALASQKPIGGSSAAFLNGKFGVFVYKKDDFKMVIVRPDVAVGPAKTGNDTTWKIVSRGNIKQDISVGDAYAVKKFTSQTGVPVFDFTLKESTNVLGRWVFEAGDYYIVVALPTISRPSGTALSSQDVAAYNIIGANIASTVRVQAASTTPAAGDDQTGTTGANSNTTAN